MLSSIEAGTFINSFEEMKEARMTQEQYERYKNPDSFNEISPIRLYDWNTKQIDIGFSPSDGAPIS